MTGVLESIKVVFTNIFTAISDAYAMYFPKEMGMLLMILAVLATFIGIFVYIRTRPTATATEETQLRLFDAAYKSLGQGRKGLADLLALPVTQASKNNWVLLNFAPLTAMNAGYVGPMPNGTFTPAAIRMSLELGVRCFVFPIDFYTGSSKDPSLFAAPEEPCLLYRDQQGVIRSENSGSIADMMKVLDQTAFSSSLASGKDPLIVILDFKNTPDPVAAPAKYLAFLSSVSQQIQVLRRTYLARAGDTIFSNLTNPNLLFTQGIQSFSGKTLIFTNVNTDVFTKANVSIDKNLRSMINAQIFTTSGDTIPGHSVTTAAPKGTQIAVGKQTATYFLTTPPEHLAEAQLKTNNVYTVADTDSTATTDRTTLLSTYGVQMIPFNPFSSVDETTAVLKAWGVYSWILKPPPLQYVVLRAEPPKPLSPKANSNQGNVGQPALHF
jgi:hypothetical protein